MKKRKSLDSKLAIELAVSLHIFELIRVYLVCLRCNRFEKQFLQWWLQVDNNFFPKQIVNQLIIIFFPRCSCTNVSQFFSCVIHEWLKLYGHNIANNIHSIHFDWMQILLYAFPACCDGSIFYCLNHGTYTPRLNPRFTYRQSIQRVLFTLKSIDLISVGWSKIWILIKIRDLLSALSNRLCLFPWNFAEKLFCEKMTLTCLQLEHWGDACGADWKNSSKD